jgi:hypothetical protein
MLFNFFVFHSYTKQAIVFVSAMFFQLVKNLEVFYDLTL